MIIFLIVCTVASGLYLIFDYLDDFINEEDIKPVKPSLIEQINEQQQYLETLKQKLYNESGIPPSRTTTSAINPTRVHPLHDPNNYFERPD